MTDYSFEDPPNTACISCVHITKQGRDILFVSHDADDGVWQFLCGEEGHEVADSTVVGLGTICRIDPSLNRISDLPLGFCGE